MRSNRSRRRQLLYLFISIQRQEFRARDTGNRLTRANLTDAALSESYDYDGLNRLTSVTRGETETETESWTLDSLGNFLASSENGVSQTRTTDQANEITSINNTSTASDYDLAGNMTVVRVPSLLLIQVTSMSATFFHARMG